MSSSQRLQLAVKQAKIHSLLDTVRKRRVEYALPELHEAQMQIVNEAARFNVLCCGRRFGKTTLGEYLATEKPSLPVGWFSPTYKMLLEVWRKVTQTLQPITVRKSVQEKRLELKQGGVIEFWSLDNPDAARGRKYARILVDEAAMVNQLMDVWNLVLYPTLLDYKGDAWFKSTPRGRNGFFSMYQWGVDPTRNDWRAWQMPTSANPYIDDVEIENLRRTMPERIYSQEILAQFLDDAGGVFRNVMGCATATAQTHATEGHSYVFGVDWGKINDFTVITVIDTTTNEVVYMDRFNQIDYTVQRGRLVALYERFRPMIIYAESNSIGAPNIEQLQAEGLPVQPFNTTAASKSNAINALSLAFERADIKIIPDDVLINELQSYEAERLPSGSLRYNAPDGLHDDCVMSLAIGWHGVATYEPAIW